MQTKKCSICGEVKPITEFYKAKREKFGVAGRCKACKKPLAAKHYQDNKEKLLKQSADYYASHKEERSEWERKYRAEHEEEKKAYRLRTKDHISEYNKQYYQENKESLNAQNKAWRETNAAKLNALVKKRYAMKLSLTPYDADLELIEKFYTLAKIMEEETGQKYHVDHIVPLSKCGPHHEDNLQVILATVNLSKKDKDIDLPGIRKHDILNNPVIIEQLKQYKEKRQS